MKTKFDLTRFGMLLKWDLKTNRRFYLTMPISVAIAQTFIFSMLSLTSVGMADYQNLLLDEGTAMACFFFIMMMILMAANIFCNMKTKQARIAFLMLPGTLHEKYLVRLFGVTVMAALSFLTGLVFADAMQYLISELMGANGYSVSLHLFMPLPSETDTAVRGTLLNSLRSIAIFLSLHSFYVFCGALFRFRPMLLASCIFIGVTIFFIALDTVIISNTPLKKLLDSDVFDYLFPAFLLLVTVFFYWASFRIFTRMQVINNKWINL